MQRMKLKLFETGIRFRFWNGKYFWFYFGFKTQIVYQIRRQRNYILPNFPGELKKRKRLRHVNHKIGRLHILWFKVSLGRCLFIKPEIFFFELARFGIWCFWIDRQCSLLPKQIRTFKSPKLELRCLQIRPTQWF